MNEQGTRFGRYEADAEQKLHRDASGQVGNEVLRAREEYMKAREAAARDSGGRKSAKGQENASARAEEEGRTLEAYHKAIEDARAAQALGGEKAEAARKNIEENGSAANDRAELEVYGSKGRTYVNPETGEVIADGQNEIPGRLAELSSTRAEVYQRELEELTSAGLELAQAKLVMDLREEDQQAGRQGNMLNERMAAGESYEEAEAAVRNTYAKKDAARIRKIVENGILSVEEYRTLGTTEELGEPESEKGEEGAEEGKKKDGTDEGEKPDTSEEDTGEKESVSSEKLGEALKELLENNPKFKDLAEKAEVFKKATVELEAHEPKEGEEYDNLKAAQLEATKALVAARKEAEAEAKRLEEAGELKVAIDGKEYPLTAKEIMDYINTGKLPEIDTGKDEAKEGEKSDEEKAKEKAERDAKLEKLKKAISDMEGTLEYFSDRDEDELSDDEKTMLRVLREHLEKIKGERDELAKAKESEESAGDGGDEKEEEKSLDEKLRDNVDKKMKDEHEELLAGMEEARNRYLEIIAKEQKKTWSFRIKPDGFIANGLRFTKFGGKLADRLNRGGKEEEEAAEEYAKQLQAVMDQRNNYYSEFVFDDSEDQALSEETRRGILAQDYIAQHIRDQETIVELQQADAKKPMSKWLRRTGYAAAGVGGGLLMLTPAGWAGGLAVAAGGAGTLRTLANRRNALTTVKNEEYEDGEVSQADLQADKNEAAFQENVQARQAAEDVEDMDAAGLVGQLRDETSREAGKNKARVFGPVAGAAGVAVATKVGADYIQNNGVPIPFAGEGGDSNPDGGDGGNETPPGDGGNETPPGDGGNETPPGDGGEFTGNTTEMRIEPGDGEIKGIQNFLADNGIQVDTVQAEEIGGKLNNILNDSLTYDDANSGLDRVLRPGTYPLGPEKAQRLLDAANEALRNQ